MMLAIAAYTYGESTSGPIVSRQSFRVLSPRNAVATTVISAAITMQMAETDRPHTMRTFFEVYLQRFAPTVSGGHHDDDTGGNVMVERLA
jgi:hypothetical protein